MFSQLVYTSSAVRLWTPDELDALLAQSRARNTADGVTGALVYCDGTFVQALEGLEAAVEAAFARIARDPHHRGTHVLLRAHVPERQFPDWAMGFCTPAARVDSLSGFRSVFELTNSRASRAHRLLAAARALDPLALPPRPAP